MSCEKDAYNWFRLRFHVHCTQQLSSVLSSYCSLLIDLRYFQRAVSPRAATYYFSWKSPQEQMQYPPGFHMWYSSSFSCYIIASAVPKVVRPGRREARGTGNNGEEEEEGSIKSERRKWKKSLSTLKTMLGRTHLQAYSLAFWRKRNLLKSWMSLSTFLLSVVTCWAALLCLQTAARPPWLGLHTLSWRVESESGSWWRS